MALTPRSSLQRYREYRRRIKSREPGRAVSAHGAPVAVNGRPYTRARTFVRLFLEFWGMLRGHRPIITAALASLAVSTVLNLIPPYGFKLVFDNVLGGHPLPRHFQFLAGWLNSPRRILLFVVAFMVVTSVLSELIGLWSRWQATRMTKRVQVSVRRHVFEHAVDLPLHRVYELKSGGVASILREDAGGIAELIFSMLYNPWRAIIQLAGTLIILAGTDWRMLLGSLLLVPTVWITHRTWIARIRPLFRDVRMTRQGIDARATEAFGGMRVVRSFSRQKHETASFSISNHLMARQEIFAWWWMRGIDFVWAILVPVATALLLYYGGLRVLAKSLTIGELIMFLTYLIWLLGPIATLAGSATALQNSLSGLDRILDLLEEPKEMPSRPGAIEIQQEDVGGRITLENVTFAYPSTPRRTPHPNPLPEYQERGQKAEPLSLSPGKQGEGRGEGPALVLRDISLDVLPGQMIALVGPSGAGKTTLCNLIARFYDPTEGRILLDGRDLRDITAASYRRLLGIVEQDTFLFDGTVAQNIAYGRRGAGRERIVEAARRANAHEFIEALPQGYETFIGERGVKLSGGQRQRLTIARAILADPKILILDEATSNLDTESERLIQHSLAELMRDRTTFAIAHRLSTIVHADLIIVLENGTIVEQGTHQELMGRSGRYRDMVLLQTAPPAPPRPTATTRKADEADREDDA